MTKKPKEEIYHHRRLIKAMWEHYLNEQPTLEPDPRFPARPDSEVFELMSRIARALDEVTASYRLEAQRATPEVIALVGGDLRSVHYMGITRVHKSLAQIAPNMTALRDNMSKGMTAAWMDGWMSGALFALESGWPDENDEPDEDEESTDG